MRSRQNIQSSVGQIWRCSDGVRSVHYTLRAQSTSVWSTSGSKHRDHADGYAFVLWRQLPQDVSL